jgi:hypothetical protein
MHVPKVPTFIKKKTQVQFLHVQVNDQSFIL